MAAMGADASRVNLPGQLSAARAVVLLSPCRLDEAIAPVEVLLQEGLNVFSVDPAGRLTPGMLANTFGPRLTIGVHDLRTVDQAHWAVEQGASFAFSLPRPEIAAVLADARVPHLLAALTPVEVDAAWRSGAAGVQVVPANAFGGGYATQLTALVPGARLVARGAETAYEVKAWLGAGAVAVCLAEKLLGEALRRGDLAALRSRARAIADAVRPFRH